MFGRSSNLVRVYVLALNITTLLADPRALYIIIESDINTAATAAAAAAQLLPAVLVLLARTTQEEA
jgi:hypothetical protein